MKIWQMAAYCLAGLALPPAAIGKSHQPEEPEKHPDWGYVADFAVNSLRDNLVDPNSLELRWDNGFAWAWIKDAFQPRRYGWLACGNYNAKNRLGGYAGRKRFITFVDQDGAITVGSAQNWANPCYHKPLSVIVNSELVSIDASNTSIADELKKLAELKDSGALTTEEFERQKARVLGR